MSLPELCATHQEIKFFNFTTDFAEKQGLPVVYYPKKWKDGKKPLENQHEKAVPYLKNRLHLVKNKLGTSIILFLVTTANLTRQVLSRIPGQKAIFPSDLSLLQDWNPTQQTILQLLFATFQRPEI